MVDALSRHPEIEFVAVRHEEWGTFAASADAQISDEIVAVCGTAGPGITHLLNGLVDAYRERAKLFVIAGDVETDVMDTQPLQGVNPYDLFRTAAHWVGRAINPAQAGAVFDEALRVCQGESRSAVVPVLVMRRVRKRSAHSETSTERVPNGLYIRWFPWTHPPSRRE